MADRQTTRVYGIHAARGLLERRPEAILCAHVLRDTSARLAELSALLERRGIRLDRLSRSELDRLSDGGRHQGVVLDVRAAAEFDAKAFEALVLAKGRVLRLLVLDQVEDPRNLGACLRTAEAAGVDAVVVPRSRAARLSAAARKAASEASEIVPVHRAANLARTLAWLKKAGVWIVGTDADAKASLYGSRLETPIALVLGGEGKGLRRLTREHCDELVAIPMLGQVASLNVSVAAGVVLFELLRQCPGEAGRRA